MPAPSFAKILVNDPVRPRRLKLVQASAPFVPRLDGSALHETISPADEQKAEQRALAAHYSNGKLPGETDSPPEPRPNPGNRRWCNGRLDGRRFDHAKTSSSTRASACDVGMSMSLPMVAAI